VLIYVCSALSLRVERASKPVPVKRRRPTVDRSPLLFHVPLVYIFVSSHVLANVANAAPVAGYPSKSATLLCLLFLGRSNCPRRGSIAGFPGVPHLSLRHQRPPMYPSDWLLLPRPTGLAPMTSAKMTSTIRLGPPGEASLHAGRARIPRTTLLPSLRLLHPFSANASCGAFSVDRLAL